MPDRIFYLALFFGVLWLLFQEFSPGGTQPVRRFIFSVTGQYENSGRGGGFTPGSGEESFGGGGGSAR